MTVTEEFKLPQFIVMQTTKCGLILYSQSHRKQLVVPCLLRSARGLLVAARQVRSVTQQRRYLLLLISIRWT